MYTETLKDARMVVGKQESMAWLKWYEIIKNALIGTILIAVIILVYQFPSSVDKSLLGAEIDHKSGLINRELEINIDGVISKRIIGKNRFWGMINIGDLDIKVDKDFPILLSDMDNTQALIKWPDVGIDFTNIGIIYTDDSLSEIMILMHKDGFFSSNQGAIIYVSSKSEDDIILSTNNMLKETFFRVLEIKR